MAVLKTVQIDGFGDGQFVVGAIDNNRSNKQIMLAITAVALGAGTILGKVDQGTRTVVAGATVSGSGGTPGNGVYSALSADDNAQEGTWQVVFLNPAANAGFFEVRRPDGTVDGNGNVGVAYNGQINFTVADGANDFQEDDRTPIVVDYTSHADLYKPLDPAAVDGSQVFAGILWGRREINTATQRATGTVRSVTVNGYSLVWPVGVTDAQKAQIIKEAEAAGVIILF